MARIYSKQDINKEKQFFSIVSSHQKLKDMSGFDNGSELFESRNIAQLIVSKFMDCPDDDSLRILEAGGDMVDLVGDIKNQ